MKYIENLSDEKVVVLFKRNPYYQAFCGQTEFSLDLPCDSTESVHFRKRIGEKEFDRFASAKPAFPTSLSVIKYFK